MDAVRSWPAPMRRQSRFVPLCRVLRSDRGSGRCNPGSRAGPACRQTPRQCEAPSPLTRAAPDRTRDASAWHYANASPQVRLPRYSWCTQLGQRTGEHFVVHVVAVPDISVLGKADTLALDGVGDERRRAAWAERQCVESIHHLAHLVPVDLADFPTERAPLFSERV